MSSRAEWVKDMNDVLDKIKIENCEDFVPSAIFECGQAFRWNRNEDGAYTGIAFGRAAKLVTEGKNVYIICSDGDYEAVWRNYFDTERDYAAIRREISREKSLECACEFGKGIRILRQEPWEALCSFIISQCNNIPRIKKIVESLCRMCGDKTEFCGEEFYSFPSAECVARLSREELGTLRAGYRAEYIAEAAKRVSCGDADLGEIASLDTESAKHELLKFQGVGEKVASCTLLFGMGKLDAFPIDVWMKRAIEEFFGKGKFDYKRFGNYAGLAQQYMFHYMRNKNSADISNT